MTHGYVQFNRQGTSIENQRQIIKAFAAQNDLEIENWIEDDKIRAEDNYNINELNSLLKNVKEGDIIIFYDISLLGNYLNIITDFIITCMRKNIQVWTINDNKKFGNNNDFDQIADALQFCMNIKNDLENQED